MPDGPCVSATGAREVQRRCLYLFLVGAFDILCPGDRFARAGYLVAAPEPRGLGASAGPLDGLFNCAGFVHHH